MSRPDHAASVSRPILSGRTRRGQMRWRAIGRIAGQLVRRSLLGWPLYVTAFVAFGVVTGLLYSTVWFAFESGVYILARPFALPMQVVTTIGLLFVLFSAALSKMPSRKHGLQSSAWTAAGELPAQVTARLLAGVTVYGLLLLILFLPLALVAWVSNLVIPPALLWGLTPSLLSAGVAVSLGLFIAVAAKTKETAVVITAWVVVASMMLQTSDLILASLPPASPYQPLLPLLHAGRQLLPYVSPLAASDAMLDAALRSDFPALLNLVLATLLIVAVWLAATCLVLKRKDKQS